MYDIIAQIKKMHQNNEWDCQSYNNPDGLHKESRSVCDVARHFSLSFINMYFYKPLHSPSVWLLNIWFLALRD